MKYPRTYHLPASPGVSDDDKILKDISHLIGKNMVYTEKLDGECTSMTNRAIHARSETSSHHPSQSWVKQLHARIKNDIPENIQIVGENMYAKHSILYDRLTTFFYAFVVIDLQRKEFFSFSETIDICFSLDLEYVPLLDVGAFDPQFKPPEHSSFGDEIEGYVVRTVDSFPIDEFDRNVAKFVRKNHVNTDEHWKEHWLPNKLKFPLLLL